MELKRLLSLTRQAIDKYSMIEDGDKIAVGISGGKDSLTLLYALSELRRFYPKKFDIEAVTIDAGFDMDYTPVKNLCDKLDVPYTVINTDIKAIVFDKKKVKSPCSLCAKMRRGALNDTAAKLGCNKVAYGHHKDDVVSTLMLSLFYEGRFQSVEPYTYLDGSGITVIRPLIYVQESEVIGFMNKQGLSPVKSNCPADGYTKREYINELLNQINRENPGVKDRIFTAISDDLYKRLYFDSN